jgi:hypothetical protein
MKIPIVVGWILTSVFIEPDGEIDGLAIDYFSDLASCFSAAIEYEAEADFGIGFVCLEDTVEIE